ncbi:hypothetical protein SUGI_0606260 [Cryptomeria japonica]|nr:hypothetical protein SUGI_0606260 [Cryptomeria japonica]
MQIEVKASTGQTITVEVKESDKIYQVKRKLLEELGIPRNCRQDLFHATRIPMNDNLTVGDYSLRDSSLLYLQVGLPEPDDFNIIRVIVYKRRKSSERSPVYTMLVEKSERVGNVKEKLSALFGLDKNSFFLEETCESNVFDEENKTLGECNVHDLCNFIFRRTASHDHIPETKSINQMVKKEVKDENVD